MHIHEFQKMMRRLYFHRDSKRGVKATYNWLADELLELVNLLKEVTRKQPKDFADVIAWLASLANITGIDLESTAIQKYNGKCPKCTKSPCKCNF